MGNVRLGCPQKLVMALKYRHGVRIFVETGTYKGQTATWAAEHFSRVISIEGYEPRFRKTAAALAGKHPHLRLVFGDSRKELKRVIAPWGEPLLFWLDAHWCGEGAHDSGGNECPLREELAAINAHPVAAEHIILIDDARLFQSPPPYPHDPTQWPSEREVYAILSLHPRFIVISQDVIIAVPMRWQGVVLDNIPE